MADPYSIRAVSHEEFGAFHYVAEHAFHAGPPVAPERLPLSLRLFEPDRSLAAFDPVAVSAAAGSALARDGDIVGTAGAYSFQMAVPGAVIPVAGVSYVSVMPTHRRRGIARTLMTRQLQDIAARGSEAVAALWASEATLYGRYGYGQASTIAFFRFGRGDGALTVAGDASLTLRLVPPADALPELTKVYDAVLPAQPGFFARDDRWWTRTLFDPEAERGGGGPLRCLLASDPAGPRGYALYRAHERWDDSEFLPDSTIRVRELVAADPAAGAALWRDLLSRDLLGEVVAQGRPADDPLLYQLADPRRARPMVSDGLWVRVVDLPRALAARAYSSPVDVVLEVRDEILPVNAGRWRLRASGPAEYVASASAAAGGSGAATCERTDDAADVALDIRELGAAYLGGTRLGALAGAGLVTEHRPGAVARLSAAMSWDPAPWCPVIF